MTMPEADHELSIERVIEASPAKVWQAYTERTEEWFAPKPWRTRVLEWDLRPGGRSAIVMTGPDGADSAPMEGVFLEVIPERRIVFTDAFSAGWVPSGPFMVAIVDMEPTGDGQTRYTATVRHWTAEALAQHEAMGFRDGWGTVAAQLAAIAEAL